jgi:hypothetical protein
MSNMLYRAPGPHNLHGVQVEYVIVNDDEIEAIQAEGWCLTPLEAQKAFDEARDSAMSAPTPELPIKRPPGRPRKVVDVVEASDR